MGIFRTDKDGKEFDDGINAVPGDPEFTRDLAEAHFKDKQFSYVGTPAYVPAIVKAELADLDAQKAEDAATEQTAADKLATASQCKDCGATIIP